MRSFKKRKTNVASTELKQNKEGSNGAIDHKVEVGRKEEVFLPEISQVAIWEGGTEIASKNVNGDSTANAPEPKYLPAYDSFVSVRRDIPGIRVRLNLPNLVVPPRLLQTDEDAMRNLHLLLKWMDFEVSDRATLAFFAIGSEYDIKKAAQRFIQFYNIAKTESFKYPDRKILESLETDNFFEGFALHDDGTFGSLSQAGNFGISNQPTPYHVREVLCYIVSMVDLGLVRSGFWMITNAQKTSWKNFKPYEVIKLFKALKCVPLKLRGRLVIDPGMYVWLARKVFEPLAKVLEPVLKDDPTVVLSLDEARRRYPHLVLPTSLTGLVENKLIKRLSANEQLTFNFFIDP